jgi:hypothetical protein
MNEQNSNPSRKRNVLIGGAIGIAAALIALSYTIDFPPGAQNTVGTIVPAQRFRAEQPTAIDVSVGIQSGAQTTPIIPASQAGANQGANLGANNGANLGANNGANLGANNGANLGANNGANLGANNGANLGANNGANLGANNGANLGANNGANLGANQAVK